LPKRIEANGKEIETKRESCLEGMKLKTRGTGRPLWGPASGPKTPWTAEETDPKRWWVPKDIDPLLRTVDTPCRSWQDTRQWYQMTKQETSVTTWKQWDILWSPRTNSRTWCHKASSRVFHGATESEWLDFMEEWAPNKAEEETIRG
jgi:hypothetical protein